MTGRNNCDRIDKGTKYAAREGFAIDGYKTLSAAAQDEFTEKRSRFIGYARPVASEREALDFIALIRSKHWDAKHNVYAYQCDSAGHEQVAQIASYSVHREGNKHHS